MGSDEDLSSPEILLRKAMLSLRDDLRLTQVQLSVAIGTTPTSIYRYEAAETFPETGIVVKLWDFALRNQSHAALYFAELLALIVPPLGPVLRKLSSNLDKTIEAAGSELEIEDRILALALIKMLKDAHDPKTIQIMSILLEPWMKAAKSELTQGLGVSRVADFDVREPEPEHSPTLRETHGPSRKTKK